MYSVYCVSFTGFVTDGEFNSLKTQGSKRPVSVIQLTMDAKNEAQAIPSKNIEKFFRSVSKGTLYCMTILDNYLPNYDYVHVHII